MHNFDSQKCINFVQHTFDSSALPSLMQYIKIPNLSRNYDNQWNSNGKLQQAAQHIKQWILSLQIKGLKTQIVNDQGYAPLIFTQVQGTIQKTIFFYGHYDKQPAFEGWDQGLGAINPVVRNGKLYGRGGADDGYATYGTMIAIKAIQLQGIQLPRCVMITEGDQESGSGHMPHYLQILKQRIGNPEIIFCLDSGTMDYDRFWLTKSLRGNLVATLRVQTLKEGVHSGDSSGITPSCFRIAQMLLNRIQNVQSGKFNEKFFVDIPADRYQQNYNLAKLKGMQAIKQFPFVQGCQKITNNPLDCLLNRGWRPTLTVTGINGLPKCQIAGNVTIPFIQIKFSLRMPPTLNSDKAVQNLTQLLTQNVPYGAKAQIKSYRSSSGWNAPSYDRYLQNLIDESSLKYFKNQRLSLAQGGSIPLMGKLVQMWPKGQFIISGVLGPNSNAHGPNESLDLGYTKNLICSIAHILAGVSLQFKSK